MDAIISKQVTAVKKIQKLNAQLTKEPIVRRTREFGDAKLQQLASAWNEFESNDELLDGYRESNSDHRYFVENYYKTAEKLYEDTREAYQALIRDAIERTRRAQDIEQQHRLLKKQNALIEALNNAANEIKLQLQHTVSEAYASQRQKLMTEYWNLIVHNHGDIVALGVVKDDYFNNNVFRATEAVYQETVIQLESARSNIIRPPTAPIAASAPIVQPGVRSNIQLPRIDIPKFSGDYLKWIPFKDLFTELIHNNNQLTKSEKFYYLKSNLEGVPNELVQHLGISSANYDTAWDIICRRYNNMRTILTAYLNALLEQPTIPRESAQSIRKLHDTTTESLAAIKNLEVETNNWDPMIVHILLQKLDKESRRLYEQSLNDSRAVQTLKDFMKFLESRFQSLESSEATSSCRQQQVTKGIETRVLHSQMRDNGCPICKGHHRIYICEKFNAMNPNKRSELIRKIGLCFNCLREGHQLTNCKSLRSCNTCKKRHHSLIHTEIQNRQSESKPGVTEHKPDSGKPKTINSHMVFSNRNSSVLLATAMIRVLMKNGYEIVLRALIDQGSQASFITEEAAQRLRLPRKHIHASVSGVGQSSVGSAKSCISLHIKPNFSSQFETFTDAIVLRKLTNLMPTEKIVPNKWKHTEKLLLANPHFHIPSKIDVILGADIYADILLDDMVRGPPGTPIAQKTQLGWILFGGMLTESPRNHLECLVTEVDVDDSLSRFWELEELESDPVMTTDDVICEEHFKTTHRRDFIGNYTVRIPFKEDPEKANIGGSRELALARLHKMEGQFKRNKVFETLYRKFMHEYQQLGHMVPVPVDVDDLISGTAIEDHLPEKKKPAFYFPHHAVMKTESTTTKLRVVFDASCKRLLPGSQSLNDIMYVGPKIQGTLYSTLLRWRKHAVVYTADIEKMFRMIRVDERDRKFQRILWRDNPNEVAKEYELTTVTYGTAAAPFLAVRTLHQLAYDHQAEYPDAAKVVLRDAYVDDFLSGADTTEDAVRTIQQLIDLLKEGGFNLRKWSSNNKDVLNSIPRELREQSSSLDFDPEYMVKTLGVYWNPSTDTFKIQVNINTDLSPTTRRELHSDTAKIYDPIGLLAPITMKVKLLMKEVTQQCPNVKDPLPHKYRQIWHQFKSELPTLKAIEIPRWIKYKDTNQCCELHGFCDASEVAYSAAVYLRITYGHNTYTSLLTAKTKVAPSKPKQSIPKLELCGAQLLAKLLKQAVKSLDIHDLIVKAWSDSEIVLAWIRGDPNRWQTFVANRVSEIQTLTNAEEWYHVRSEDNPADPASRGILPSQLVNNNLWWHGPQWLQHPEVPYPKQSERETELEKRKIKVHLTETIESNDIIEQLLTRFSKLTKIQRILAYTCRFINNCKTKREVRMTSPITVDEAEAALEKLIIHTQHQHFGEEIRRLMNKEEIPRTSRLSSLSPKLENGILRVEGRLEHAMELTYDQKHPIILPHSSTLTNLVIQKAHEDSLHGLNTLTLQTVRQRYWIVNGLKAVKGIIHKCVKCHRYNAKSSQQMMGMLPTARVTSNPAFTHSGVDFAGPFDFLVSKGRGNRTTKGYLAIFVCLTCKAFHIEVVSDLTAAAFIAALKRFHNRRGPVAHLYSDNATNFVGANKILGQLHNQQQFQNEITEALVTEGIQWHFIPPASPHFGGLWEAGVKSVKHHLRRVIGDNHTTFEEMSTLMTQIEACLNSRPLAALSENIESLETLTPSHFLNNRPIKSLPEKDHLNTNPNLLTRWERLEKLHQEFWRKWSTEYLGRLQQRPKWMKKSSNIEVGNLVLIKVENLPPSKWALGRVIETHPGVDGLTRVATLRVERGTMKRPITKLSLLPIIDNKANITQDMLPEDDDISDISIPSTPSRSTDDKASSSRCIKTHYSVEHRKRQRRADDDHNSSDSKQRTESSSSSHPKSARLSYMLLILALFLPLILGEETTGYNITTLSNREGIYFDHISEINLYSKEWKLVVYYDMSTYWKEYHGITTMISKLEDICTQHSTKLSGSCEGVLFQLKHQLAESEDINEVLYGKNNDSFSRAKRGLFNAGGLLANRLFGVLDQEFAEKYEQHIKEAKENDVLMKELLRNQTSLLESTLNVLKKKHETVQQQIFAIKSQLQSVTDALNHSQHEIMASTVFNSAVILLTLSLQTFQNIQRALLTSISDTRYSKVNTLLLTPLQLNEQLRLIREHISHDLVPPSTGSSASLLTTYNSLRGKVRVTQSYVIVEIMIPLLKAEKFNLFRIIPIPAIHKGTFIRIEPSSKYLVINTQRDRFSTLQEEDLKRCQMPVENTLLCHLSHPIFTLKSNQSRCEIDLLNKEQKISSSCNLHSVHLENMWMKLHAPNKWLYFLIKDLQFQLLCEDRSESLTLGGIGTIELGHHCILQHSTIQVQSDDEVIKRLDTSILPENRVISQHLEASLATSPMNLSKTWSPLLKQEVNMSDILSIEDQLRKHELSITKSNDVRIHDVHHYTGIYTIIILLIVCIICYWRYMAQHRCGKHQVSRPVPTPRRLRSTQATSLPSLFPEVAECA